MHRTFLRPASLTLLRCARSTSIQPFLTKSSGAFFSQSSKARNRHAQQDHININIQTWLTYCGWRKSCTSWFIGSLSHYLQGFIHPMWLFGISSTNSSWKTHRFFSNKNRGRASASESLIAAEVCLLTGGDYMAAKRRYTLENREVATSHNQRFLRSFRTSLKNLSKGKMSMQKMVGVFKSSISSFFIKPRVLVPRSLTKREERWL